MSTKPPTAVMIPSVSSSGFKAILDLLELVGVRSQLLGRGGVRLPKQRSNFVPISGFRLQRPGTRLQLLAQALAHRLDVNRRELALACLLIDQRPFGAERARFADR